MAQKDAIVPNAPLWLQRSRSEIAEARSLSIIFAQTSQTSHQKDDDQGLSKVVLEMLQFSIRSCATARIARTFFHMLREAATSGGQRYTVKDVEEAERLCLAALARQLARPFANRRKQDEASSGDEGANSEDELSGEEAVDLEEHVNVTPELMADLGVELTAEERAADDNYAAEAWEIESSHILPGHPGFNRRANAALHHAPLACSGTAKARTPEAFGCPPLQPHQEIVGFLVHPRSPMKKLLVDHPTGSGKTWEMIRVLDNFFYDPRPKIPIFPKAVVCRNFYMELLRWPNRYRDYFCCERPQDAAIACGNQIWQHCRNHMWDLNRLPEAHVRQMCRACRDVLEMKGHSFRGMMRRSFREIFHKKHPGEPMPLAPLRAVSYASAGGAFSSIVEGQPLSAVMKIGYQGAVSTNVYSNKVVLMDEIHNLVRSETKYSKQLFRLRDLLGSAMDLVLVGFTGTPILSHPREGLQLMEIVKGDQAGSSEEGFLSSLATRPKKLFPRSCPAGIPDGILTLQKQRQFVHKVELQDEALNSYDRKRQRGLVGQRLRTYCNVCSFASSFHDGRGGSKAAILARPDACCPKLLAIAEAIASSPEKAVVMTGRSSGYRVILEILRQMSEKCSNRFGVATMDDLSGFNHVSNLRGETFRVLVADSAQCSEGVSFLAVRRAFISDVPTLHSQFVQMCGRSIRMYGHRGLSEEEQNVETRLYIATLPKWMKSSLACWAFRAQSRYKSGKAAESGARTLLQKLQSNGGFQTLDELKSHLSTTCLRRNTAIDKDATSMPEQEIEQVTLDRGKTREFLINLGLHIDEKDVNEEITTENIPRNEANAFMQAVRSLCLASSADDSSLGLSASTADEDALQELARQSQQIAPALSDMRSWAVDKDFLHHVDKRSHAFVAPSSFMPNGSNFSLVAVDTNDHSHELPTETTNADSTQDVKPTRRVRGKSNMQAWRLKHAKVDKGCFGPIESEKNAEALKLECGQCVRIGGLTGAVHLNGLLGVVERFEETSGRWIIRLENGELKSLRLANCLVQEGSGLTMKSSATPIANDTQPSRQSRTKLKPKSPLKGTMSRKKAKTKPKKTLKVEKRKHVKRNVKRGAAASKSSRCR